MADGIRHSDETPLQDTLFDGDFASVSKTWVSVALLLIEWRVLPTGNSTIGPEPVLWCRRSEEHRDREHNVCILSGISCFFAS